MMWIRLKPLFNTFVHTWKIFVIAPDNLFQSSRLDIWNINFCILDLSWAKRDNVEEEKTLLFQWNVQVYKVHVRIIVRM